MFRPSVRITGLAAFMLVVLRLSIGWHFLYEGIWKYQNPGFSAEAFLRQARGPFAEKFQSLIPDFDGRQRLTLGNAQETWEDFRRQFSLFYDLSEEQQADTKVIYQRKIDQLKQYLTPLEEEIKSYLQTLDDLEALPSADQTVSSVPFQQRRYSDRGKELRAKAAPWIAEVDRLRTDLRKELDLVLTPEQRAKGSPPQPRTTLDTIDTLTTYGLLAIGLCLMAGLFTRLACLGGAIFLLQIVLCQPAWPGIYPPLPPSAGHSLIVNKELIEMIALLALATTPVGRWGGLDFFVHHLITRPLFAAKEESRAPKS